MPDMLCPLIHLPPMGPHIERLRGEGISLRRPNPWERTKLFDFVRGAFSTGWADEAMVAFAHQPVAAFVAARGETFVGFSCYECSRRNYFGPTGVLETERGRGVGGALFLAALHGLQDMGYTYCIIGDAGPVEFYQRVAGAIPIPIRDGKGIYGLADDPKWTV